MTHPDMKTSDMEVARPTVEAAAPMVLVSGDGVPTAKPDGEGEAAEELRQLLEEQDRRKHGKPMTAEMAAGYATLPCLLWRDVVALLLGYEPAIMVSDGWTYPEELEREIALLKAAVVRGSLDYPFIPDDAARYCAQHGMDLPGAFTQATASLPGRLPSSAGHPVADGDGKPARVGAAPGQRALSLEPVAPHNVRLAVPLAHFDPFLQGLADSLAEGMRRRKEPISKRRLATLLAKDEGANPTKLSQKAIERRIRSPQAGQAPAAACLRPLRR